MEIEAREARMEDAVELVEIDKIAREELIWWQPRTKEGFLDSIKTPNTVFVAVTGGKMIGYADCVRMRDVLYIDNIYVLKDFRDTGAAKRLMEKIISCWLGKVSVVSLSTSDMNMKIFEKLGFRKTMNYMEYKGL